MERIETSILKNLIYNEEYSRKVIPFIKPEYFEQRSEKVIFEEITNFIVKYGSAITIEALNIETEKQIKDGILVNKTFMFAGKLDGISRAEAKSLIEKNSGTTLSSISKNLDYLVTGEKPTKSKINRAKSMNIKIISQNDLLKLLN